VPNYGALAGVPDDVVVEVPAIVNKKGIQPIRVEPLPEKILYTQILPEWLDMERDLLAYHTGDRSLLLWSALQAGQTNSYDQATAAFEDLMAMAGNEASNEHYGWETGQEMLLEKVKK
jgi:alpha-galactosidase